MEAATLNRPRDRSGNPIFLAVGDSIIWGQGLLQDDKFCYRVYKHLKKKEHNLQFENRAHSGATILCGSGPEDKITAPDYWSPTSGEESASGEVPRSKPTILEQVANYDADPSDVRYILMDGGINDVSINNLVNPLYPMDDLDQSIEQHCHREMTFLLRYIVEKFTNCRVIVTGYFPILSGRSDPDQIPFLLLVLGLPALPPGKWRDFSDPTELALEFWRKSNLALKQSVKDVKDPRVVFVDSGFLEENALFASKPFLREPELIIAHPEYPVNDKVYDARGIECQKYPQDFEGQIACPMGSLGHPIEAGATRYFKSIVAGL